MRIRSKLLSGYLIGALLTGVVGYFGIYVTRVVNVEFAKVSEDSLPVTIALDEVRFTGLRIVSSTAEYAFLVREGRAVNRQALQAVDDEKLILEVDSKLYRDAFKHYEELENNHPEDRAEMEEIKEKGEKLQQTSTRFVALIGNGAPAQKLLDLKETFEDQEREFLQAVNRAQERENIEVVESQRMVQIALANARKAIFLVTVVILILMLVIGIAISASISQPITRLQEATRKIGGGELDTIIAVESRDEVGELAQTFNQMTVALKRSRDEIVAAKESAEHSAAELQESNDELRNFTYIFFHDLREPMVNLKGFTGELQVNLAEATELVGESADRLAERVRERLIAVLRQEAPEALRFINVSVQQMNNLFNAILALSLLTRRKLKPEALDMAELVQSAAAAHVVNGSKLTIGPLPALVADRTYIKMIIGHLLDNAMKYLEPGRPGEIEVNGETGDGSITIHIRDNGRGVAHEDLSKIFDIFRRAGKQDVPGEGMGLPYSKTMIRRHGGRIWCVSEPGVGSTFSFSIPLMPDIAA